MVVRFTWQRSEWREAYLLATTEQDRSAGPVPMGYLIVGITAMGGLGDLVNALRSGREAVLQDSLLPALLLVTALAVLAVATLAWVRRRERFRNLPMLPTGEQQLTVHEQGWAVGASAAAPVNRARSWSELSAQRTGRRVLTLLTCDGDAVSVPLRVLTDEQGGWLERLLARKMPRFG